MDEEKLNTPLVSKETSDSAIIAPQAAAAAIATSVAETVSVGDNGIPTAVAQPRQGAATTMNAATDALNGTATTNVNLNANTQLSIAAPALLQPQPQQQQQQLQQLTLLPYSNHTNFVGNNLKNGALSHK